MSLAVYFSWQIVLQTSSTAPAAHMMRLPGFRLILKSISPPTGQPHATLPFTCQRLKRSWQASPEETFCHIWHSLPINNLQAKRKSLYEWLRRWVSHKTLSSWLAKSVAKVKNEGPHGHGWQVIRERSLKRCSLCSVINHMVDACL